MVRPLCGRPATEPFTLGDPGAMNIFELFTFLAILAGATLGGIYGFALFGTLGALVGVPTGGVIGYGVAFVGLFLFAGLMSVITGDPLFKPKNGT